MKFTPSNPILKVALAFLTLTSFAGGLQAITLVEDTFTRSGNLDSSSPDTGPVWSGSAWTTSGSELDISGNSASLISGLTFLPNTTYTLTIQVDITSGGSGSNDDWIGFGFTTAGGNPALNSKGFMLHKVGPLVELFSDGLGGQQIEASSSPFPNTMEIELATGETLASSTLTYRLNGTLVGNTATTNASTLDSVFIQNINGSIGTVDNFVLTADLAAKDYLKAGLPTAGDQFGYATAVSEDGDLVVVGAYYEDSDATGVNGDEDNDNRTDSGAVYVFEKNGSGGWEQTAYLKAEVPDASDAFGLSVDISGETIIVSAHAEDGGSVGVGGDQTDNSKSGSGAAYIFHRTGGVWSQQAYLKSPHTDNGERFGWSVAISGDIAVVGVPREGSDATGVGGSHNNSLSLAGAAHVYERSGSTWSHAAFLKASNTGAGDEFGWSVDIDFKTIIVGARGEASADGNPLDDTAAGSGAAYIYRKGGNDQWTFESYLKASNIEAGDSFGHDVSIQGETALVGAPYEDGSATGVDGSQDELATDAGAAYVFDGDNVWTEQAYLKASNTAPSDLFGYSVAITGGGAIVGAVGEDSAATQPNGDQDDNYASSAGAAYLFLNRYGVWGSHHYLKASNTNSGDNFGISVALGDGTVLAGANTEDSAIGGMTPDPADNTALTAGAAYVCEVFPDITVEDFSGGELANGSTVNLGAGLLGTAGVTETIRICNDGLATLTGLSYQITGVDAVDFMISGGPSQIEPGECSSLTVIYSPTTEGTSEAVLEITSNDEDEGLITINLTGFGLTPTTIAECEYLKASNTAGSDFFGYSVAISCDTAVVGAYQEDSLASGVNQDLNNDDANTSGAAYVYVRDSTGQWRLEATLKSSNTRAGNPAQFGCAVSISGNTIVVGALNDAIDSSSSSTGAAYVFVRSGNTWMEQATLRASSPSAGDRFGHSVAISEDTVAVGTYFRQLQKGAVYTFDRDAMGQWSEDAFLQASNGNFGDRFGWAVSLSGNRLAVGAPEEDGTATDSGAAYVFERSGTWTETAYLKSSNIEAGDQFGWAVAISGDALVVGAPFEEAGVSPLDVDSGAAYVFAYDGSWTEEAYLRAFNADEFDSSEGDDQFGYSVAIDQNLILVGARHEAGGGIGVNSGLETDNSRTWSGSAYLYERGGASWVQQAYLKACSDTDADDEFGFSVGVSENTLIVGAPLEASNGVYPTPDPSNNDAEGAGAAYIYQATGATSNVQSLYSLSVAAAGLTGGDAEPNAIPFGDGVENLLKFAFNMDLSGPDIHYVTATGNSGLPCAEMVEVNGQTYWRFRFVERADCGLVYCPEVSKTLLPGSWMPMMGIETREDINSVWQRVTIDVLYDTVTNPKGFGRVSVKFLGDDLSLAELLEDFAIIPAGSFVMGDSFNEGDSDELPLRTVFVSAFAMGKTEVTNAEMAEIMNWALEQGLVTTTNSNPTIYVRNTQGVALDLLALNQPDNYLELSWSGSQILVDAGRENYPCLDVNWYAVAAYANYKSAKEGKPICYDVGGTWSCDFTKKGYRLPTEAEWEKAARGGQSGKRFPWGNEITHNLANYYSQSSYNYDTSATRNYHPTWSGIGNTTSSVGSFAANGYGLYDMAGNLCEWCNDRYGNSYYGETDNTNDPRGPNTGPTRVLRGGSSIGDAINARCSSRFSISPTSDDLNIGFRLALDL